LHLVIFNDAQTARNLKINIEILPDDESGDMSGGNKAVFYGWSNRVKLAT